LVLFFKKEHSSFYFSLFLLFSPPQSSFAPTSPRPAYATAKSFLVLFF